MTPLLKKLMARYQAPAGDDGADTGGAGTADLDVAVLDDDDAYMARTEEERSRLRGDSVGAAAPADPSQAGASAEGGNISGAEQNGQQEDDAKSGQGIPRARFNEVNDRRKALEAENEELRAQLAGRTPANAAPPAAPPTTQAEQGMTIEQAEEQYAQLMLDGDTKAAAALRLQINAAIEEAALARFRQSTESDRAQAQAVATIDQMLGQFPWLEEPEGAEVLELIEASAAMKMQRGMSKAQAISEATLAIAPKFAPAPYRDGQGMGASGDIRTQRANERGANHSLQQPPLPQAGMGNRATPPVVDTSKLSDEEYMALPEAERKKARGD